MRANIRDVKLPSKNKEIDCHDSLDYWTTSIKEGINWASFLDIVEYTAEGTEDEITLLLSLLKIISMIQISCWYNKGHDDQNKVEHIAIRCINCGK